MGRRVAPMVCGHHLSACNLLIISWVLDGVQQVFWELTGKNLWHTAQTWGSGASR